jgi:hypothetical protein
VGTFWKALKMRHCFQSTLKMEGRRSSSERATASWMRWLLEDSHSNTRERLGGSWEVASIVLHKAFWDQRPQPPSLDTRPLPLQRSVQHARGADCLYRFGSQKCEMYVTSHVGSAHTMSRAGQLTLLLLF